MFLVDGKIGVVGLGGRDCRSCRTPLIGVVGFGVVRDDDVVGGGGGIRVQSGDERQSEECSADLGGDETGRGAGRDTGEGVGENPTDGDGGGWRMTCCW